MSLDFLYTPVSWVLLRWHQLLTAAGLNPDSGLNWSLSIVLLVVTARLLLFRLFVKQLHYQRHLQRMQPKITLLSERYKSDRAELNRRIRKLQQDEGFSAVAGCLPMFLQLPVFLALYHVLRHLSNAAALCAGGHFASSLLTRYTFSSSETCSGARARLFGAPLSAAFRDGAAQLHLLGGALVATRWVILPLLLISAAAALTTQLLVRATTTVAPEGTGATAQRVLLYLVPLGVLASGLLFNFPLGVLLYWFTSNVWTLAQQVYILRFHPPPDGNGVTGGSGPPPAPRVAKKR